jgi:hypothetical protein
VEESWKLSSARMAPLVLTEAPLTPPVYRSEVWRLLAENILPNFQVATFTPAQYSSVLQQAAEKGWTGGLVYDALHLACAISAHCKRIYRSISVASCKLPPQCRIPSAVPSARRDSSSRSKNVAVAPLFEDRAF